MANELSNLCGEIFFVSAEQFVFIVPEQRWRQSMRPCFMIVCRTLDVAAFRCLGAANATRRSAEYDRVEVGEVRLNMWEC